MKKFFLNGLIVACLVSMTSCFGDEGRTSRITSCGYLEYSPKANGLLIHYDPLLQNPPLYVLGISNDVNLMSGETIFFDCIVDLESAENTNWKDKGYMTATGGAYELTPQTGLRHSIYPEINSVAPDEQTIADVLVASYLGRHLFLAMAIHNLKTSQKNDYYLSWDSELEPEVSATGNRTYSLYLRVTKREEGVAPLVNNHLHAFDIGYFYTIASEKEKSAGKDAVSFNIHYPKEFSEDLSTVRTWNETGIVNLAIPKD